jgi:iron complex transport system substrate-binding protein
MKIVSLAPSATEILYALDAGDAIAANTRFCDYPPPSKEKPKIGGWLDIKPELVLQHNPDLIVASSFLQDKIVQELKDKGKIVHHSDPKTLTDVFDSILSLSRTLGRTVKGREVVDRMKKDILSVAETCKKAKTRPKVYVEEWHRPPTAAGNWVPELISIAGGQPPLPKGAVSSPVDLNQIVGWNPDIIILSWCGFGMKADVNEVKMRDGWEHTSAVKEGRVYVLDDSLLNRPGPRLGDGARLLARMIHPELF